MADHDEHQVTHGKVLKSVIPEKDSDKGRRVFVEGTKLNEELWGRLPEVLVEEVIMRLPFKLFFQCCLLSRAWGWSDESQKNSLSSRKFEEAITSISWRWPSYCPLYLFREGLVGYNNLSQAWQKIFDLKMFPFIPKGVYTTRVTSCAGSLICLASVNFESTEDVDIEAYKEWVFWKYRLLDHEVYVVNVVTRKWRLLPPRPNMQRPDIMHMIPVGPSGYKLILLTQLGHIVGVTCTVSTQIYDSESKSWTEERSQAVLPKWQTSLTNYAYLDGVFYIATGSREANDRPILMTHDVVKNTWSTMIPPLSVELQQSVKYHVLLCGAELILVVRLLSYDTDDREIHHGEVFERTNSFQIFKLDLAAGQIKEEALCPHKNVVIEQVTAHGSCIYFGGRFIPETPLIIYDVSKREWSFHSSPWESPTFCDSCLPTWNGETHSREPRLYHWTHYALEPGVNPFARV